jgi:hypothetical protein
VTTPIEPPATRVRCARRLVQLLNGYLIGAAAEATHCHLAPAVLTHVSAQRSLAFSAFPAASSRFIVSPLQVMESDLPAHVGRCPEPFLLGADALSIN